MCSNSFIALSHWTKGKMINIIILINTRTLCTVVSRKESNNHRQFEEATNAPTFMKFQCIVFWPQLSSTYIMKYFFLLLFFPLFLALEWARTVFKKSYLSISDYSNQLISKSMLDILNSELSHFCDSFMRMFQETKTGFSDGLRTHND